MCLGEKSRSSEVAVFPAEAVKWFLTALQKYIARYVRTRKRRLYEVFDHPVNRARVFKEKKANKSESDKNHRSSQATAVRGHDASNGYSGYSGPIRAEASHGWMGEWISC